MNTVQRIGKNIASLFAAEAVAAIFGLALSILIARTLGEVVFGHYSFALAFTGIFAVFLDLGFNRLIVRDVARNHSVAGKYLGNIAIIKGVLAVVVFAVMALAIRVMDHPRDVTLAVQIFGLYIILVAFGDLFRATFRAFERMEYEALASSILRVTIAAIGIAAVLRGYALVEIALSFFAGGLVYLGFTFLICRRKFAAPKVERDLTFIKSAVKTALPLSAVSLATVIYFRIDTVMLSVMKGAAEVGWYNAAHGLVFALNPIPVLFAAALFPRMSALFVSDLESLKSTYQTALRYLLLLGLPMAAGTMLLSHRIIPLFYGVEFAPAGIALRILAWHILLYFLCAFMANVLVALNRQNQMAITAGGCALINIILNLALIPRFSYMGAAIATIVTETVLVAVYFRLVSKHLDRVPFDRRLIAAFVACAAMAVFVYHFRGINFAALIISAAVIYFVILWVLRGLDRDDLTLLRQAAKLRKR